MKKKVTLLFLIALTMGMGQSEACTNLLVSKGASADGSTMVTYTADSHQLYGCLYYRPAKTYPAGTMMDIHEWETGKYLGQVEQVTQTYSVVGNMNEHQLIIAESTFGGRELSDSTGLMDYGSLIYITLQRAKTAREAIGMIDHLVSRYGYYSGGESFSIADPNEVWHMELIGKGTKIVKGKNVNKGAVWVAMRLPEGYIGGHANQARITTFPLDDPESCLYSADVISFARQEGFFKEGGLPFSFADAYAPLNFGALRYCEARVWSAFHNATHQAMGQYLEYAMGIDASNRLPLFVKPAQKLSAKEVMWLMRDHYEGSPMDMTRDLGAGGHNLPYRWRPIEYKVENQTYLNERAIATQQTGFWFLGQARSWLPNTIGGILWFGVDDSSTSCLTPIYSSTQRIPEALREENGNMTQYSPTSAFWLFNRVANFAYLRYDLISADIKTVINEVEDYNFAEIPSIDAEALKRYHQDPQQAIDYLSTYSVQRAQALFHRWDELDKYLLVKYIDGNMKRESGGTFQDNGNGYNIPAMPIFPGYNDTWKNAVAGSTNETLKVLETKNLPDSGVDR